MDHGMAVEEPKRATLPDISMSGIFRALEMESLWESLRRSLSIKPSGSEFWDLVVPAQGQLTYSHIIPFFADHGGCRLDLPVTGNLDCFVQQNMGRESKGEPYYCTFERATQALGNTNVTGISLRECLLLNVGHKLATGYYLDPYGFTVCMDSRFADGAIPTVGCNPSGRGIIIGSIRSRDLADGFYTRRALGGIFIEL